MTPPKPPRTLAAELERWTGIRLPATSEPLLEHALGALGLDTDLDRDSLLDRLGDAGAHELRERLVERLVVGTTWFLREPEGLSRLCDALARAPERRPRLWCAGVSSGEEPLSLAMLLLERGIVPDILATDLNARGLARGQAARYPWASLARLPGSWCSRFVRRVSPEEGEIMAEVRRTITWSPHNLLARGARVVGPFDAIVCRNVLFYFPEEAAREVLARFATALSEDGWLLVGASEFALASGVTALAPAPNGLFGLPGRSSPATGEPLPPAEADPLDAIRALANQGEIARALSRLDHLLANSPLHLEAHLWRGLLYKRQGRFEDAIAELQTARFLARGRAWMPAYLLATCLEHQGPGADALVAFREAAGAIRAGVPPGMLLQDGADGALEATVLESCNARLDG
jgi:chemotaxis protein methyltransferase CheR